MGSPETDRTINPVNIAVIGAGAVGTYYGALLQKGGFRLQFYSRGFPEKQTREKLFISSINGDFSIDADLFSDLNLMEPADIVVVSTKALPGIDYHQLLSPVVKKGSIIVLLQNGIYCEEKIVSAFPYAIVLGGTAFTCINRKEWNRVEHIDYGQVRLAPYNVDFAHQCREVVAHFSSAGIKTEYCSDLLQMRWQKLLWNIPFNGLSVLLRGASTHDIIAKPETRALAGEIMDEIAILASKDSVTITKEMIDKMIENTVSMAPYKTSMLLDFESGREMEVDAIIGAPLKMDPVRIALAPKIMMLYQVITYLNKGAIS